MADRTGQQLGNYRILNIVGRGGFAEVYLGEHIYLKTQVAIKILQSKVTNEEDLEGFLKEARTIAHLVHPNIVRVMDFGVDSETPFLVMDYASNGTLRRRHPKGSILPLNIITPYIKQVAAALQSAHDEKLIHRDVKPENMLLGRKNEVLLSDFGIALIAQSSRYQSTQDVVGTVAYMSPEQIQGKPRPASDQYSLAIVVYEWLTGDRPFHGSFTELCTQHMFAPPPPLRERVPTISPDVEQVVTTALAKDPRQRFGSVQAFANALEQASQGQQPTILKPPPSQVLALPSLPLTQAVTPPPSPQLAPTQFANVASVPWTGTQFRQEHSTSNVRSVPQGLGEEVKVWRIGRRQIIAMVIGSLLLGIISPFTILSPSYVLLPAIVVLIFFGVVYGPWVGLVAGGVGTFVSYYTVLWHFRHFWPIGDTLIDFGYYYYFLYRYQGILFFALIGFIAGLALLATNRRYNKIRTLGLADIIGAASILVGLSVSWILPTPFLTLSRAFSVIILPNILFSLLLLPVLLFIYNRIITRKKRA